MNSANGSKLYTKYPSAMLAQATELLRSWIPSCGLPIYSSIDIRDSGTRLVAVDVNLFPAGFNNLSIVDREKAAKEFASFFEKRLKHAAPWKIALVPESHTSNNGYVEHLNVLQKVLADAGAQAQLAWSGIPIPREWKYKGPGGELTYTPLKDALAAAEAVVLNHDLSGGPLAALEGWTKNIFPNPELGWYKRKKSDHFEIARKVLTRLSHNIKELEPRDFLADSVQLEELDLSRPEDFNRLAETAKNFYVKLQDDYQARGDTEEPFVFVKNDSGTYGMGIWKFRSLEELLGAEQTLKRRFSKGKQSVPVRRIIFQEGIRTRLTQPNGQTIEFEPVVYSVNGRKIGTFFRYGESEKDVGEKNLNQPGAWFEDSSRLPEDYEKMKELYEFVATLHSISAALEDCPCDKP